MARYIDADKLFLHFNDWALAVSPDERHSDVPEYSEHKIHEMIYRTINEAMSAIEQQPTADVVPSRYGCGSAPYCSWVFEVDEDE